MLRMMPAMDPHHMVLSMQQAFPLAQIPGVDLAEMTAILEKYGASLTAFGNLLAEGARIASSREYEIIQNRTRETFDAIQILNAAKNPIDAITGESAATVKMMERHGQEELDLMRTAWVNIMDAYRANMQGQIDALQSMSKAVRMPWTWLNPQPEPPVSSHAAHPTTQ
jgi:hypothetical protein